ncbi:MAG: PEP-CTERM sorting domain-containing protein [Pirellulales bacterium]
MKSAICIAVIVVSVLAAREAAAVQLTLNLVQSESHIVLSGDFSTLPFLAQEGSAGTTDLNLTRLSTDTTFQGTITVDVDNAMSPTSIQILSSAADADVGGLWLPEVQNYLDLNGNGEFGEFGLPPDGDSETATSNSNPAPAAAADWGVRVFHPAFQANIAWAAARDIAYNVTSAPEAVNGLGQFSSSTENFEFATGWFDYWVAPAAGNLRGRAEFAGGDDDNLSPLPSTYIVTPLPGNQREIRLIIPIEIDAPGDDANFAYDGVFVATKIVPEPSTLLMFGTAAAFAAAFAARRRK